MSSLSPLRALSRALLAVLLLACSARAQFVVPGPELRLNGFVFAVESDPSGNVYLGGSFNEFNGDVSSGLGLLRLSPGGAKHPKWDIGSIDGVSDLLVQGDFLYVAGSFSTVRTLSAGTISRAYLMRIFLTGANEGKVDTTWAPLPNGPVNKIESNGSSLYLAGVFSNINGTPRTRLAKLSLSSAALDTTWNPMPNNSVADIELADGRLYVSGGFTTMGSLSNKYLVRLALTGAGAADTAWLPDINLPVGELESADGFLYFGGGFSQVQGSSHRAVGRFSTATGAAIFDTEWRPEPNGEVSAITVSGPDVYLSGVFTTVGGANRRFMAKVSASGSGELDGKFQPEPNGAIQDLKLIGTNVLSGGRFNTTNGASSAGFALMEPGTGAALKELSGTISTKGEIYSMKEVSGGMIIGGLFDSVNGVPRTSIAKILSNGSLDPTFNVPLVGYNRLVRDMKLDGTSLYFCGDFLSAGGVPCQHVARVDASTGTVDASWHTKPLTPLLCLETDGSYVYIGSSVLKYIEVSPGNSIQVFNLARLSKDGGALDTTWLPSVGDNMGNAANASVADLQINGTKLLVGGKFGMIANPAAPEVSYKRVSVASLATTGWGQPDAEWATEFYDEFGDLGYIRQLLLHNNALYVAGNFVSVLSPTQPKDVWIGAAKLNLTTGAWNQAFDVSPALDNGSRRVPGSVSTLAASGAYVYVGGDFDYTWDNSANQGDGDYFYSPDIVRVNQNSGVPDLSWYPYPDEHVSTMAFTGSNLWIFGSLGKAGDTPVKGTAIVMPYTTPYQTWLNTYFSAAQIANSDYTAPFMDPDGDGDSNLVEAAFNTDPFNPAKVYQAAWTGISGLPLIRPEILGGQRVTTIEFTRWKASANAGIAVNPQFGDDLTGWPRTGTMISNTSLSPTRERVKFQDSSGNLQKAFGRVTVDTQTP